MAYQVSVTVYVPDVEADTEDEAINFVTEAIEDSFDRPVTFDRQSAIDYSK
jgi:hypothetical protein